MVPPLVDGAGAHVPVGRDDAPGRRQEEADGQLGHAVGVAAGGVQDRDAPLGGAGHVDVGGVAPGRADDPQAGVEDRALAGCRPRTRRCRRPRRRCGRRGPPRSSAGAGCARSTGRRRRRPPPRGWPCPRPGRGRSPVPWVDSRPRTLRPNAYLTRVSGSGLRSGPWTCRRSSAWTTTSSSRPHVWQTWLPEKYRERGPKVERQALGQVPAQGRRPLRHDRGPRGPVGRRLVLRRQAHLRPQELRGHPAGGDDGQRPGHHRLRPLVHADDRPPPTTTCAPAAGRSRPGSRTSS